MKCNNCGINLVPRAAEKVGVKDIYGAKIEFTTGYFSPVFIDGVKVSFRLCEYCLRDLMKGFASPGEVESYLSIETSWDELMNN